MSLEKNNVPIVLPDSFFSITDHLYQDFPMYIPEEKKLIQWLFSPENVFFEQGKIWIHSEPTCRLVGLIHPDYGENKAYFGFWETVLDFELNQDIFAQMEMWAISHGCTEIVGPIQFSTFYTYRLLLNTEGVNPFPREPFNPPYYCDLLKELGYSLYREYFTDSIFSQDLNQDASFIKGIEAQYTIHPLNKTILMDQAQQFAQVSHRIFLNKEFYCPSMIDQFYQVNLPFLAHLLCPKSSFYATTKSGELVGYYIVMPHYGELTSKASEQLGVTDLDYNKHFQQLKNPKGLVKTVGVIPEHTKSGLIFALALKAFEAMQPLYTGGIMTALTSQSSRRIVTASSIDQTTQYGLFSKQLGALC